MLKIRVKQVSSLNISSLSIACNTAHMLLKDLQKQTNIPFVSMINEVVGEVVANNVQTVGVLATPSTLRSKPYQSALEEQRIEVILPNSSQIETLEEVIRNIIAGEIKNSDTRKLKQISDSLKKRGARAIILGCTELPLVFPKKYFLPIYNSVEILAKALLRKYYQGNTIHR